MGSLWVLGSPKLNCAEFGAQMGLVSATPSNFCIGSNNAHQLSQSSTASFVLFEMQRNIISQHKCIFQIYTKHFQNSQHWESRWSFFWLKILNLKTDWVKQTYIRMQKYLESGKPSCLKKRQMNSAAAHCSKLCRLGHSCTDIYIYLLESTIQSNLWLIFWQSNESNINFFSKYVF